MGACWRPERRPAQLQSASPPTKDGPRFPPRERPRGKNLARPAAGAAAEIAWLGRSPRAAAGLARGGGWAAPCPFVNGNPRPAIRFLVPAVRERGGA